MEGREAHIGCEVDDGAPKASKKSKVWPLRYVPAPFCFQSPMVEFNLSIYMFSFWRRTRVWFKATKHSFCFSFFSLRIGSILGRRFFWVYVQLVNSILILLSFFFLPRVSVLVVVSPIPVVSVGIRHHLRIVLSRFQKNVHLWQRKFHCHLLLEMFLLTQVIRISLIVSFLV